MATRARMRAVNVIAWFAVSFFLSTNALADEYCAKELPETLNKELAMMNYCNVDADCIKVKAPCPVCDQLINKENIRSDGKVDNLQTAYIVSNGIELLKKCETTRYLRCKCPDYQPPFTCVKNKCVGKNDHK